MPLVLRMPVVTALQEFAFHLQYSICYVLVSHRLQSWSNCTVGQQGEQC